MPDADGGERAGAIVTDGFERALSQETGEAADAEDARRCGRGEVDRHAVG